MPVTGGTGRTGPADPADPSAALSAYTQAPNRLESHYRRFRVGQRLLLTGHSHQAWPDVAAEGPAEAFEDAALDVDGKWDEAMARAEAVREGYRVLLGERAGEIALGGSTHELVVRFLSGLDLRSRPRLVTTDGEFHSLRRQLARLEEEGVEVVRVGADPVGTLAERLAGEVDDRTAAVLVSAVLFETSRIVPHLGRLAEVTGDRGAELLVDAYHALGPVPFRVHERGLSSAWVTGGGYKYLQLGEGNAFLRMPDHADRFRPVVTGWFTEFGARDALSGRALSGRALSGRALSGREPVRYPSGAARFAGATYDPTSHYRAARVFAFFAEQGLTPHLLRQLYQHQLGELARSFDTLDLPEEVATRDRQSPLASFGGFVAVQTPHAARLRELLAERGVTTDSRGPYLRFGPAPYLTDAQLHAAMAVMGDCAGDLPGT